MKIIIIEDERLLREALAETLLSIDSNISIVKTLSSVKQAISYFKNSDEKADIIFSDIQLGDGLSFDIFKSISISTPTIYCTAFDEYAIASFKNNGIDYLLKPFDRNSIESALIKYKALKEMLTDSPSVHLNEFYKMIDEKLKLREQNLLVYQGDKIIPVKSTDIAFFYLENGITFLKCFDEKQYIINDNLDSLELKLSHSFYRINRQFIINRNGVKEVNQYFGRKLLIIPTIPTGKQVLVSKGKSIDFLNWLKQTNG